jgi:hypothetical protein
MTNLPTIIVYWVRSVDLEEEREFLIHISKAYFTNQPEEIEGTRGKG